MRVLAAGLRGDVDVWIDTATSGRDVLIHDLGKYCVRKKLRLDVIKVTKTIFQTYFWNSFGLLAKGYNSIVIFQEKF
jgi:hypothetical protein